MSTIHELCVSAKRFRKNMDLFLKNGFPSFFSKNKDIISNNNIYNNNIIIIKNKVGQPIGNLKEATKPPQGYQTNITGGV